MRNKTTTGTGRGRGQMFAVEKFGVEKEVLNFYKENIPASKISKFLAEKGIKIAPLGINRWLAKQKRSDLLSKRNENIEQFQVMVTDYKNEITTILNEVKEMKQYAKDEKKLDIYVKLVGKLFQGLELLAKLMGDIKPQGSVDINIIINEINRKMFDKKKSLRSELYNTDFIDVEAEIEEDDKKMEMEIRGEKL